MKLLFNHNGLPTEKPYEHDLLITFDNVMKNKFFFSGTYYKPVTAWLEAVRKTLLALGISDFQYTYPPKKTHDASLKIKFLFKEELHLLQFQALAFGDKKGIFSRMISSQTKAIFDVRLKNIESFLSANDISHQIIVEDGYRFKIVTYSRFDDLAIATHFANESFDKGIEKIPSPQTARLLTKF